jgi:hypothetical protein
LSAGTVTDLPDGWQRHTTGCWIDERGNAWRRVPRRRLRELTTDEQRRARVVARYVHGRHPMTGPGALVLGVVLPWRYLSLADVLGVVQQHWTHDDDALCFVQQALADSGACLAVVVPAP